MKKIVLSGALALILWGFASGSSVTIINSGFTFSPDNVGISFGDTVIFQIASIHDVIEVSEATWNANGNTALSGGFSLPFGGGQLTGIPAGVHYYVCGPHASLGMKGKITVAGSSGISDHESGSGKISISPNPTSGKFVLQYSGSANSNGGWSGKDSQANLEIYNILGEKIADVPDFASRESTVIDLTSVPEGVYFVRIYDRNKIYTERVIKK